MVHSGRGVLLIGILGKDPSCENEIEKDKEKERTFVNVTHKEVLNFIKKSQKGLKNSIEK